ncbi:hypothetical protein SLEP1_g16282 [Rubroshorea leprosula]|uniref:Uncharacterized protein n=1 Tax=Rubroshorea leprosula TaxID=152421 RepID=A0AAV5IW03_9ROSI|nr:hypothetical protein SLEP1_g16282 [Rubroshorea leprosula]
MYATTVFSATSDPPGWHGAEFGPTHCSPSINSEYRDCC